LIFQSNAGIELLIFDKIAARFFMADGVFCLEQHLIVEADFSVLSQTGFSKQETGGQTMSEQHFLAFGAFLEFCRHSEVYLLWHNTPWSYCDIRTLGSYLLVS